MGRAFEGIKAGLEDAIAFMQGDETRGRVARVGSPPVDVRAIRAKTGKTRQAFATAYRLPLGTVRDWEQAKRRPDTPARVLLAIIDSEPEEVERLIAKAGVAGGAS